MTIRCGGILAGVLFVACTTFGQTTWTSPTAIMFPSTPVGSYRDSAFMVYGGGMSYTTNYRFYVTASAGFGVSWSPSGPFQSSLMLQLALSMGYQSWCYVRYSPTSSNMIGSITVQITLGYPSYAPIYQSVMGLNQVLPVQIASFDAVPEAGRQAVRVTWSTLTELNNYGFEIQRRSGSDAEFVGLPDGFIEGHATTLLPQHYAYMDHAPYHGRAQYRLKQIDLDGAVHFSDPIVVDLTSTGVQDDRAPASTALLGNYPNPFNPTSDIRYQISEFRMVRLVVYDFLGREVAMLVNEPKMPGTYQVRFDASGLASGIYFCRMSAGRDVATKAMMLVR
jgi:hypothetical protein